MWSSAVDVWTYDLLHIAIDPYNDQDSAAAFLLALRAKGYHRRSSSPICARITAR